MSTYTSVKRISSQSRLRQAMAPLLNLDIIRQASVYSLITIAALLAFELFNFSTTEFALTDLLGDLQFASLRWSTILALAFCGMDFAGIARLFSPEKEGQDSLGRWYLLGAWLLAATMNALLTWWAVSLALLNHHGLGNEVLGRDSLLGSVPVFVAVLVWLIRVLMIGSFTMAGNTLFNREASCETASNPTMPSSSRSRPAPVPLVDQPRSIQPAPKPIPHRESVNSGIHASGRQVR
ncbi:MAG: hypothetical protein JXA97_07080 [Anaerolineales bacterium]|nr:hypothetical protein [Anaerolineales bacterium]